MSRLPQLALACAVLAMLLLALAHALHLAKADAFGDAVPFDVMLAALAALALGTVLASLAIIRGVGSARLARLGLFLNSGVLTLLLALAAIGIATFPGG